MWQHGTHGSRADAHDEVDGIVAAWRRERPDLDVEPLQVLSRLDRLAGVLGERRAAMFARHGLRRHEFDVLAALRREGEPFQLTAGELAARTYVTSGTMTSRLDGLTSRGLVERAPDVVDGRLVRVALTASGRRLVDGAFEALLAAERELLAPLPPETVGPLAEALRALLVSARRTRRGGRVGRAREDGAVTVWDALVGQDEATATLRVRRGRRRRHRCRPPRPTRPHDPRLAVRRAGRVRALGRGARLRRRAAVRASRAARAAANAAVPHRRGRHPPRRAPGRARRAVHRRHRDALGGGPRRPPPVTGPLADRADRGRRPAHRAGLQRPAQGHRGATAAHRHAALRPVAAPRRRHGHRPLPLPAGAAAHATRRGGRGGAARRRHRPRGRGVGRRRRAGPRRARATAGPRRRRPRPPGRGARHPAAL